MNLDELFACLKHPMLQKRKQEKNEAKTWKQRANAPFSESFSIQNEKRGAQMCVQKTQKNEGAWFLGYED